MSIINYLNNAYLFKQFFLHILYEKMHRNVVFLQIFQLFHQTLRPLVFFITYRSFCKYFLDMNFFDQWKKSYQRYGRGVKLISDFSKIEIREEQQSAYILHVVNKYRK